MAKKFEWVDTEIVGVISQTLVPRCDERGSLTEVFRRDELQKVMQKGFTPLMGYLSLTNPGVMRGPHEHRHQTDVFVFLGRFDLYLWRLGQMQPGHMAMNVRYRFSTIPEVPFRVIVPPGVVHGYKNVGNTHGTVFNFPNWLYGGWGGKEQVDEIRHEDDPESIYVPW